MDHAHRIHKKNTRSLSTWFFLLAPHMGHSNTNFSLNPTSMKCQNFENAVLSRTTTQREIFLVVWFMIVLSISTMKSNCSKICACELEQQQREGRVKISSQEQNLDQILNSVVRRKSLSTMEKKNLKYSLKKNSTKCTFSKKFSSFYDKSKFYKNWKHAPFKWVSSKKLFRSRNFALDENREHRKRSFNTVMFNVC